MSSNNSLDFIHFVIKENILKFGSFKVKSGRYSPYFFNSGLFNNGISISSLANFYAKTLLHSNIKFDVLFGPAYKGIPLVTATAMMLGNFNKISKSNYSIGFAFNRKEEKNYGEKGLIIGHPLKGKVVIVDDVITAGNSVAKSIEMIRSYGAEPVAVLIAIDRMERYKINNILSKNSASEEITKIYGIPVLSIASILDILQIIKNDKILMKHYNSIIAYLLKYGIVHQK
ncbi:MAG: orotate phosphoribosyltransferase [Bordetella sp.]|nr:MAG: orotate phosphoribosyltransferase [Bordetella sp.]